MVTWLHTSPLYCRLHGMQRCFIESIFCKPLISVSFQEEWGAILNKYPQIFPGLTWTYHDRLVYRLSYDRHLATRHFDCFSIKIVSVEKLPYLAQTGVNNIFRHYIKIDLEISLIFKEDSEFFFVLLCGSIHWREMVMLRLWNLSFQYFVRNFHHAAGPETYYPRYLHFTDVVFIYIQEKNHLGSLYKLEEKDVKFNQPSKNRQF